LRLSASLLVILFLGISISTSLSAAVYKWVDEKEKPTTATNLTMPTLNRSTSKNHLRLILLFTLVHKNGNAY